MPVIPKRYKSEKWLFFCQKTPENDGFLVIFRAKYYASNTLLT
jgi:hypothetical protein